MFAAGANVVSVDGYVLWFPGCHIWFPGYHGMNKKCEFLTNRIKYVGHNITQNGNCPPESKFDLINDWQFPTTGQSLGSFYWPCIILLRDSRQAASFPQT